MIRNLPEPPSSATNRDNSGKAKAHAALDAVLEQAICRRATGKVSVEIDLNEGGVRAVKIGTEEIFKHPS